MKRIRLLLVVFLVTLLCGVALVSRLRADAPPVVINEILPGNASTNLDPVSYTHLTLPTSDLV